MTSIWGRKKQSMSSVGFCGQWCIIHYGWKSWNMKCIESKFDISDFINIQNIIFVCLKYTRRFFVSSLGVKWFNMTQCVEVISETILLHSKDKYHPVKVGFDWKSGVQVYLFPLCAAPDFQKRCWDSIKNLKIVVDGNSFRFETFNAILFNKYTGSLVMRAMKFQV